MNGKRTQYIISINPQANDKIYNFDILLYILKQQWLGVYRSSYSISQELNQKLNFITI